MATELTQTEEAQYYLEWIDSKFKENAYTYGEFYIRKMLLETTPKGPLYDDCVSFYNEIHPETRSGIPFLVSGCISL